MEEKSKEYLEKLKYLEEVYRVRTFIVNRLRYFGFEFAEDKSLVPKPEWRNRIIPNGAIGLICCQNELPMSLMTPWGEIKFVNIETRTGFDPEISKVEIERFMQEMQAMFHLTQMAPGQNVHGVCCPMYSILRLPWNNKYYVGCLELKTVSLGDTEQLLLDTYNEGKQLCRDIFGRETAV